MISRPAGTSHPAVISVRDASIHNLQNVSCDIPRGRLTAVTGPSGSGKSSLVFDTIFSSIEERICGTRQTTALVRGAPLALALECCAAPRRTSTVATLGGLFNPLRALFLRFGTPHCTTCGAPVLRLTVEEVLRKVPDAPAGALLTVSALSVARGDIEQLEFIRRALSQGFTRVRLGENVIRLESCLDDAPVQRRDFVVMIDSFKWGEEARSRLRDALAKAHALTGALGVSLGHEREVFWLLEAMTQPRCAQCLTLNDELSPFDFLYTNTRGMCPGCGGLGERQELVVDYLVCGPKDTAGEILRRSGITRARRAAVEAAGALLRRHNASLCTPFVHLSPAVQREFLFGLRPAAEATLSERGEGFEQAGLFGVLAAVYQHTTSGALRSRIESFARKVECPECGGTRLSKRARETTIGGLSFAQLLRYSVAEAQAVLPLLEAETTRRSSDILRQTLRLAAMRLKALCELGTGYLSLSRGARTLSAGERARVFLARELSSDLQGLLYLLDEPTRSLHPLDRPRLMSTLQTLVGGGNTVVTIEHDPQAVAAADWIIELGPQGGVRGGKIVAQGSPKDLRCCDTATGRILRGHFAFCHSRAPEFKSWLELRDVTQHNLKNLTVRFPLGALTAVCGVSGSGKSSLVLSSLYPALRLLLDRRRGGVAPRLSSGEKRLYGLTDVVGSEKLARALQLTPRVRTSSRATVASTLGILAPLRQLYARTAQAQILGYRQEHFSYNSPHGWCSACRGRGTERPRAVCPKCRGDRYRSEIREVTYRSRSIVEVLQGTVEKNLELFSAHRGMRRALQNAVRLGLGYLALGQSADTLSSGELQRAALSGLLRSHRPALVLLDEPSAGLHVEEEQLLVELLREVVRRGHTVVVVEHSPRMVAQADYVIELGPAGGEDGGEILFAGAREEIAHSARSLMREFLERPTSDGG